MTVLSPIKTPDQHRAALDRMRSLMLAEADTPEADELEALAILVDHYERLAFPVDPATPREAIAFRMEQMGYQQVDLARVLGSRSRASEIMTGSSSRLSLSMIRKLHRQWHIPAEVLIREASE